MNWYVTEPSPKKEVYGTQINQENHTHLIVFGKHYSSIKLVLNMNLVLEFPKNNWQKHKLKCLFPKSILTEMCLFLWHLVIPKFERSYWITLTDDIKRKHCDSDLLRRLCFETYLIYITVVSFIELRSMFLISWIELMQFETVWYFAAWYELVRLQLVDNMSNLH